MKLAGRQRLMLYTNCRRERVVRFGRQHTKPADVPVIECCRLVRCGRLLRAPDLLVTQYGIPFKPTKRSLILTEVRPLRDFQ